MTTDTTPTSDTPPAKKRGRPPGIVETHTRVRVEYRAGEGPNKALATRVRQSTESWPMCACGCGNKLGAKGLRKYIRGHGPTAKVRVVMDQLLALAKTHNVLMPDEGIIERIRLSKRRGVYPRAVGEYYDFLKALQGAGVELPTINDISKDDLQQDCRAFFEALQTLSK